MPLPLAKKAVDDMAEFPKKLKMIRVCGFGEPLTNKNIADIVKYMYDKNVAEKIVLITNGSLLKPELSESLVKYLNQIIISVEGIDAEQYLKFANVKINYEKFYQGVVNLCEYSKNEKCKITAKIHGDAVKEKADLDKFYKLYGNVCDEVTVEELINLFPEVDVRDNDDSMQFRFSDFKKVQKKVCPQIFKSVQLTAEGDVLPCCVDWQKKLVMGNIQNESLVDIWNGEKFFDLRSQHLNLQKDFIEPCKYCSMNDLTEIDYLDENIAEIKQRMGI